MPNPPGSSTPRMPGPTASRGECDIYVDNKLAQFEEYLNGTLRSVSRSRHQLRTAAEPRLRPALTVQVLRAHRKDRDMRSPLVPGVARLGRRPGAIADATERPMSVSDRRNSWR